MVVDPSAEKARTQQVVAWMLEYLEISVETIFFFWNGVKSGLFRIVS